MAERIAQQLGDYRLIRLLGRGGFADVYLGEQIYLKRPVAIKLLHSHVTQWQQEDFLQEAQRLANLAHPHIVRVLHFAVERGIPYLVMEYAPNGTLRTRHPQGSQLPFETIISYITRIADALQYIHEQKLVHRDVKPENMLLGANQEILLSDFGLAAVAHVTSSLSLEERAGTPLYIAPEQLQGKPRPASDQYSLAVMVYAWICGHCPFNGTLIEVAAQHLYVPPPSLQEKVPAVSSAIERVIFTALAKDPKQRFPSVREFAVALEQAIQVSNHVESSSNAQSYINKGNALFKMAKYKEALVVYEHAIQLEPTNAQFHVNKGNVLFKMAMYKEALAAYERATQLEPSNAQFHRNRAKAALSLERFEEALASYEHAIRQESDNPYLYKERGDILFDLKRFEEALIYYEHAINLHPSFGLAYLNKGKVFEQLAQQSYERLKKQAQQAFEKAKELGVY